MRSKLRLCVNTQTPLVRFRTSYSDLMAQYGYGAKPIDLKELKRGVDYSFTPGGVPLMVNAALRKMIATGAVKDPHWISLGPGAPSEVEAAGIHLHNVSLGEEQMVRYANFKEGIWREVHGLGWLSFKPEEYTAYVEYNWVCAREMLQMLDNVDLFWVHDFQQLYTGSMIGPSAPAVFRWHIPFNLEHASPSLRKFVLKSIESFDSIIVSTKRDLEGLIRTGYGGQVYAIYPYLDLEAWTRPTRKSVSQTRAKYGLKKGDRVILLVGRMDPIKAQDVAIKAVARLAKEFPTTRLVLVGNGSFTGSKRGGLGHSKARLWSARLKGLVTRLKMHDRVVFTGHATREELAALYSEAEMVVVPSAVEGFNLTAVEGWLRRKPCVVSIGAGVSELVHDGVNGYTFNPGDDAGMTEKMKILLRSNEQGSKLGENGFMTSKVCSLDSAVESLNVAFENAMKLY